MSASKPSVLVIDDEQGILETLRILLKNSGFQVETAQGGRAGLDALKESVPDVVVTDIRMPGVSGLEILQAVKELNDDTPVILMTAHSSLQSAIAACNQGAFRYIQKPFANDDLLAVCRLAAEHSTLRSTNRQLEHLKSEVRQAEPAKAVPQPIGRARAFTDVLRLAEQVAPTESTVLIQGESGTGKEVIARYIHQLSRRAEAAFFSINCGAIPESLLESELFGHVKGSFTGAVRDKVGLFQAAHGGTFLLDEIAELPAATQVKLLRVLQEREALPVGATEPIPVDVRVIAATNRDLDQEIRRGAFRSDLYYRLNVIALNLPPLRERREDIPLLVGGFLARLAEQRGQAAPRLSPAAADAIQTYDWPGNVRELENALEHAMTLSRGEEIEASALPERITSPKREPLVQTRAPGNPTLEVIERAYIEWVLQAEGGNKTRAAEVLGIDPSTLYRKLARYEQEPS